MAKKKNKKAASKAAVALTSPPPSPKPEAVEPPPVPTELPLSPATVATETTVDDFHSIASPIGSNGGDTLIEIPATSTLVEEPIAVATPTPELPLEDSAVAEEAKPEDQEGADLILNEDEDRIEAAPTPRAQSPIEPATVHEQGTIQEIDQEYGEFTTPAESAEVTPTVDIPESAEPEPEETKTADDPPVEQEVVDIEEAEAVPVQQEVVDIQEAEAVPVQQEVESSLSEPIQEEESTPIPVEAVEEREPVSEVEVEKPDEPVALAEELSNGSEVATAIEVKEETPEPVIDSTEPELDPVPDVPEAVVAPEPQPSPVPEPAAVFQSTEAPPSLPPNDHVEATPEPAAPVEPPPASSPSQNEHIEATPEPTAPAEPPSAPSPPKPESPSFAKARGLSSAPPTPPSTTPSRLTSPPRPSAISQVIQDSRPPAPSPPVGKVRPRHPAAFDDDDDDDQDDSALIRPRLRGDPSRGSTYPPQPSHARGLFASRVPSDHYSNPPPPPPPIQSPPGPPGYHPGYYPRQAPPYYQSHNHSMSQSSGYPGQPPYGPPSHAASSPYQESWNQFPPAYPPYGTPQRHDSMGSREYSLVPAESAIEDDSVDLFSRITQAIPDLHVLLARYKETHGQLGVREELLRRADIEQKERLRNKDEEIAHMKERFANLEHKHSAEASRLRFEIGNMEEQIKELREQILETDRFKKEAEETKLALDAAKTSWENKQKELEAANANLEKTAAEEKEKASKNFEDWRSTAITKHDAEKIALAIQFDKKLKEADVMAENQRREAAAAFVKEKDELRSEHQRQQRERESSFDRVRKELETKLSAAQKDREEALIHERESREVWDHERDDLIRGHQEDRESLQRGWDEQREVLETQYKKNKEESDKAWIELHAEANKRAGEEKARADAVTIEKDELAKKYEELLNDKEKEKQIIKSVAGNLEAEKARLERLMEGYGDITEIKSKGDTYYTVSFSQLQKQIMDLAMTHFVHLPVTPPPEILEQIPPEVPSFLGNTPPSRQLRAAYVAHLVSTMVTYRVFGPFLFSLGRRYDKADSLFLSMSNHIRGKSTRKEAIWRQQTLLAAFTSTGAKQRINTAAGTVVEEIVNAVRHFADPKEEEGIKIAVRRIVKLAAETWRYARLEREMITATMPSLHDEDHEYTGPDFWPAYKPEDSPIPSLVGTEISNERPKLLMRLFPVIHRQPKHENFQQDENEKPDEGCIFHHGLALYDDAAPVEMRREELKHAGLPPISRSSATAADFPPPIIPPPRKAPPPPPTHSSGEEEDTGRSMMGEESTCATESTEASSSLPPIAMESEIAKVPYSRPIPGPIQFVETGSRSPVQSPTDTAPPLSPQSSDPAIPPPTSPPTDAPIPPLTTQPSLPESVILPTLAPLLIPQTQSTVSSPDPPPAQIPEQPTRPAPSPPTSPPSPLFAALDEIPGLHRHRKPSTSRRNTGSNTPTRSSTEEKSSTTTKDRETTSRRTSGYAISTRSTESARSNMPAAEAGHVGTDKAAPALATASPRTSLDEPRDTVSVRDRDTVSVRDRDSLNSLKSRTSTGTGRSHSSGYMCESRSAAIKGLYPNGALAGVIPAGKPKELRRMGKIESRASWEESGGE